MDASPHAAAPGTGAPEPGDRPAGGQLNAALARAIVAVHRRCVGRGPTRAQAFFRHNVVVVVLEGVLTTEEQTLLAGGRAERVREVRRELHAAMRPELAAAAERLTGRRVSAVLSDGHLDPDMASHVFILDAAVDGS
jgi:uncharacterized protein YbcI